MGNDLPGSFATGINDESLDITYSSVGNTPTAHVSTYAITGVVSDGTGLASDYNVMLTPGTLTVNPAPISFTIGNDTHAFGSTANLAGDLPATFMTNVNGQTLGITYSSVGNTTTAFAGLYPITGALNNSGTGSASDYSVTLTPGTLTVTGVPPTVTSPTVTGVGSLTATLGGDVTGTGSGPLVKRGVLYSVSTTNANPAIGGTGVTEVDDVTMATGVFTEVINGLTRGTGYSFVAFAESAGGVTYTSPVSTFTTTTTQATGISSFSDFLPGQAGTFTLLASDPVAGMQTYFFTFHIKWGDGTTSTVNALSGASTNHVYTNPGTYTVQITATDGKSNILPLGTEVITVANAVMEGNSLCVTGMAGNDTITLTAPNPGDVGVLLNGVSQGTFTPFTSIVIVPSGGTDTLVGPNATSVSNWTLTGANTGTLTNSALPAPVSFSGITNLTGGSGPDYFVIQAAASGFGAVTGGTGVNTLDYSQFATGVTVNLLTHAATKFTSATNFSMVIGGSGNDSLTADNSAGVTLVGGAGNDTLTGARQRRRLLQLAEPATTC